jgi:hypothetical protein
VKVITRARWSVSHGVLFDQVPRGTLRNGLCHGLFGHACMAGQIGQSAATHRQVTQDVDVRRTDVLPLGQAREGHGRHGIVRHQRKHALVEPLHGKAQHASQVGVPPIGLNERF